MKFSFQLEGMPAGDGVELTDLSEAECQGGQALLRHLADQADPFGSHTMTIFSDVEKQRLAVVTLSIDRQRVGQ